MAQVWLWLNQNTPNVFPNGALQYQCIASDPTSNPAGDVYVSGYYCGPSPSSEGIPYARRGIAGNIIYEKLFQPANSTICLGIGHDIAVVGTQLVIAGTYDGKPLISLFNAISGIHQADWLFGGFGNVRGMDFRNGKYYVVGNYRNTLNLGNGFTLPGSGSNDGVFVAVFAAGTGNCIAATRLSSAGNLYGYDIKTDASGNVYFTGHTNANVTFHGTVTGTYVNSTAPYTSFCAKLNPSLNLIWATRTGVSNYSLYGNSHEMPLALDAAATAVYTGALGLLSNLDPGSGIIQATDPQFNKSMDDIAVSGCAVFTVGTTVGSPFLLGSNADNFIPCNQVPSLLYMTKNDLVTCSQIAIENSTNACASGLGIVINHLNDPVVCGLLHSLPPLMLGPFLLNSGQGIVAMFDDVCPTPGPCNPDLTKPVFTSCPADQTIYIPCVAPCGPATFAASATDNCALQSITYNPASGFCFPLGTTTVVATATDVAGNTQTCTFSIEVKCQPPCTPTNLALDFDGIDDQVVVPSPLPVGTDPGPFSVACWFRDDRTSGPNDYRLVSWNAANTRFELMTSANGQLAFFNIGTGLVTSAINVRDNKWHHVAAVRSGTSVIVYYDGLAVPGMNPVPGNVSLPTFPASFRVGNYAGNTSVPSWWQGRIDEVKLWKIALSPAEVANEMLCSADVNNPDLVVHLPFDQNISCGNNVGMTLAVNAVSGGADGTLLNFALTSGCTSNWVDRGRDLLPNCRVDAFTYLEGNPGRNFAGRTKVYDADLFTAGVEFRNNLNYPVFVRRHPDGSIAWRCVLDRPGYIADFIRSDEGCFLLVGYGPNYGNIDNRSFIASIDQNGVLLWLHTYNIEQREAFTRIIRSLNPSNPAFPYTVCGIRKPAGSFSDDIVLFAIDGSGTIGWMHRVGMGSGDDEFRFDLINAGNAAGDIILAGNRGNNPVLFVADAGGTQLAASLVYQGGVRFFDIETPALGSGVLIAGSTPAGNALLAKVSPNGAQVWAREFPQLTAFREIVIRPDGRIWAVGQRRPATPYRNVIVSLQDVVSGNPTVLWQKHTERPGENAWSGADLTWYSGDMLFYTDACRNNPNGWGNEDILAVMRDFDRDTCPVKVDSFISKAFNLLPSSLVTLNNPIVTPHPVPVVSNTCSPLSLDKADPCEPVCECKFANLAFSKQGSLLTGWSVPVTGCSPTPPVPLPSCPGQSTPIYFTGVLNCMGDCQFSSLNWTLTTPNGTQFSGSSSSSTFSVPITLSMTQTPGIYQVFLTGKCGDKFCECVVQFMVGSCPPPCSCAQPAFTNSVNAGFSILQFIPGCKFKFKPKQLTECDAVEWKVALAGTLNFTVFANTTANQAVNHTFPASGQYVVCMTVTRTPPGGMPCLPVSRCWTIDVDCSLFAHAPGDGVQESLSAGANCDLSVIQNNGFTLGAEEGGFAEGGKADAWYHAAGNPELVLDAGQMDSNVVRLYGNSGYADLLYQDSLPIAAGKKIRLSLALRPIPGQVLPGTDLIVRLSNQKQTGLVCDDSLNCQEIMRIPVPDDLTEPVWLLATGYDSTLFAGKYLTIHLENPFFEDDLAVKSAVDVDNICLREFNFVDADEPASAKMDIRIFPNPNPGTFTVELPRPAGPGMAFRVIDLTGRQLLGKPVETGSMRQIVLAESLPAGLYFLQVVAEGRVLAVEKFVKQ